MSSDDRSLALTYIGDYPQILENLVVLLKNLVTHAVFKLIPNGACCLLIGPLLLGWGDDLLTEAQGETSAATSSPQTERFLQLLGASDRSLFAYVYSLTANWQDAEEVMQRLRIRVWQQFGEYEEDKPFAAWARAIAYYLVLAYRKEKSRQREFFTERILEAVSTQFESHAERLNERREALIRCLEKLDGRKRELVNEYYSSNKDSAERIAAKLSITPNALRQALFRVRKLLYECVERTVRLESRG